MQKALCMAQFGLIGRKFPGRCIPEQLLQYEGERSIFCYENLYIHFLFDLDPQKRAAELS